MIRLFSPEAFRDYIAGEPITTNDFTNNGTVVLQPKECYLEIEAINDSWQLTLKHDYDEEGRYTYIQKGCVIEAPCKVAREQTSENQLFRIFEVRDSFGVLEALAYPIAYESVYETPIYHHEWKKVTAKQLAESLSLINPKYKVETNITTNAQRSIYASETNLHSIIQSDSDYTFVGAFSGEVVYDNFTYIVNRPIGKKNSSKDNKYFYAVNITGIEVTENISDVITRIYPISSEGIGYAETIGDDTFTYIDAENIDEYPIVYARVIKYDGIKLFEEKDSSSKVPVTALQKQTQAAKAAVKKKVKELSQKYLTMAHEGNWDHSSFNRYEFVDDGNQKYLKKFSWHWDGKGHYYGDGAGHYMKNAWVEDDTDKHYWVNGDGYWDPGYDDTTNNWRWFTEGGKKWYGVKTPLGTVGVKCVHQWIKCVDPDNPAKKKWCWLDNQGNYVADTSSVSDPDRDAQIYYGNPHDSTHPINEYLLRWALPYGYIFYSYTDAVEYLKDQALLDLSMEYDTITESQESVNIVEPTPEELVNAKQDIWNLFADAIQQGFKWCETTDIAEWDWREWSTTTEDPEKNYLKDYAWHKEYVDANKKIVPKSQSVGTAWWYGYLEKKKENGEEVNVYHCIKKGWVEESYCKHYWCDADGWWDSSYDDDSEWAWQQNTTGAYWYGSKTNSENWANQWIFDSQAGKWYFLDTNGIWTADKVLWGFGTRDLKDGVKFGWKKVGNTHWWFSEEGFLDPEMAYCETFEWQSEEYTEEVDGETVTKKRYYYGDDDGHKLVGCWVEDSTGVHKLLDADGYYYEKDETSDDTDANNNTEENTDEESDDSSDDEEEDTSSKDDRTDVTYDNENWSWHGDTDPSDSSKTRYWYGRYYQNSKGEEDTSKKQYYAINQWMYVSENKAWYKFDVNGWCTAAWVSTETWEWHKDETGWWYGDGQGGASTYYAGQWGKIDSKWYFFDHKGYADPYTDDFANSKTEESGSATLETNRDGINPVYSDTGVGSSDGTSSYNEKREGVQAWIQPKFIESIRKTISTEYDKLKAELNKQLRTYAQKSLEIYSYPTLTIDVNLALLDKMDGYEEYAFLHDQYLGDWVSILYPARGMYDEQHFKETGDYVALEERIVGMTYDCVNQRISNLTIGSPKNVIYKRTGALTAKTGIIVEGDDIDVLETGYEGGIGTKYAEMSRRVQYIEG